jgi:hypothetical protein
MVFQKRIKPVSSKAVKKKIVEVRFFVTITAPISFTFGDKEIIHTE